MKELEELKDKLNYFKDLTTNLSHYIMDLDKFMLEKIKENPKYAYLRSNLVSLTCLNHVIVSTCIASDAYLDFLIDLEGEKKNEQLDTKKI